MKLLTNKELVLKFHSEIPKMKPSCKSNAIIKVTRSGEICYDTEIENYIVYDETSCYEVGQTAYPLVALAILECYCEEYL